MAKTYTKKDYEEAGSPADLVIPEGFTEIGPKTFKDVRGSLKSVVFPSTVKEIPEKLLCGSVALESVIISQGLTEIKNEAFYGCRSLKKIAIPEGVTKFGWYVFRGCTSLQEVVLPSSLSDINACTFLECSGLKSIVIPNGVATISWSALENCTSLENVVIPGSVKEIGSRAFSKCSSLKSVTIQDGTEIIASDAFEECSSLQSITLPESIKKIGSGSFCNCPSLQSINIPEGVIEIEGNVFRGCNLGMNDLETSRFSLKNGLLIDKVNHKLLSTAVTELTSVAIPDGVTEMEDHIFSGFHSLQSVSIPMGVTAIPKCAFKECTALQSIAIPESVSEIDYSAFKECTALQNVLIPSSVTSIGSDAFCGCSSLQNISISASLTKIEENTFGNCSLLQHIDIPAGVEIIERSAFRSCNSLTSVTFPSSMKKVKDYAFSSCAALTDVTILSPDTAIDTKAFIDCKAVTNVNTPKGLSWSKIKNRFADAPWGQNKPLSAKAAVAKAKKDKMEALASTGCSAILKTALDELLPTDSNVQPDSDNKNIAATKVIVPGLELRFSLPVPSDVAAMQNAIADVIAKIKPICESFNGSFVNCVDGQNFVSLDPVTSKIEIVIDNAITKMANGIRLKINKTDLDTISAALPGIIADIAKIDSIKDLKGEYILRPINSGERISLNRAVSYAANLKVPDFINELESSAFNDGASLETISIAKSTTIFLWPFRNCPMLTDIHFY